MDEISILIDSLLQHPEQWTQGEYRLKHNSGLEIWTANNKSHLEILAPERVAFTNKEKKALKEAIRKWERIKLKEMLTKMLVTCSL